MAACGAGYGEGGFGGAVYIVIVPDVGGVCAAIQRVAVGGDAACGVGQGEGGFEVGDCRGTVFQGRGGMVVLHILGLLVDDLRRGAAQVVFDGIAAFGRPGKAVAILRSGFQVAACEGDLEVTGGGGGEGDAAFVGVPAIVATGFFQRDIYRGGVGIDISGRNGLDDGQGIFSIIPIR